MDEAPDGAPAHGVRLFYGGDGLLNALQVNYRDDYHDLVLSQVREALGEPAGNEAGVGRWDLGRGQLMARTGPVASDAEAVLLWLSPRALAAEARGD